MNFTNAIKIQERIIFHKYSAAAKERNIDAYLILREFILGAPGSCHDRNKCELMDPQVGDQVTVHMYTDALSHTVIKRGKADVTIQRDNVERLDAPEITPGGFAGHCINQHAIRYNCTPDTDGARQTYTRRKNGRWVRKGEPMHNGPSISMGSHEFYDYNF